MKDHLTDSNEDYLWDGSGDPDPEIQNLENVLGTLRYQSRPLAFPGEKEMRQPSSRRLGSRLAIAATILLAFGAGALWLAIGTKKHSTGNEPLNAAATVPDDVLKELPPKVAGLPPVKDSAEPGVAVIEPATKPGRKTTLGRNRVNQAAPSKQRHVPGPINPVLAASELKKAEEGKERLMLALRYASTKLNVALKKSQSTNNRNLIHNQHRIG